MMEGPTEQNAEQVDGSSRSDRSQPSEPPQPSQLSQLSRPSPSSQRSERSEQPARSVWPRRAAIAAGAILPALIDVSHDLFRGISLCWPCISYGAFATLGLLVVLTLTSDGCARARMSSGKSFAVLGGVATAGSVIVLGVGFGLQGVSGLDLVDAHRVASPMRFVYGTVFEGLLALGLWTLVVGFPFALRDVQTRALEADRLRTGAELARLRAHLQPHFLLNTLNTVAGLVSEDPDEARRLLGALGDLLGDSLETSDEMQTLDAEVRWLRRYAEILETRHRGVLTFRWDIADGTRGVKVPRLLLQPLLENAVKHGALRRRGGGEVSITTELGDGDRRIRCVVEDNGPGPASREKRPGAMGIELVTRRLAIRYAGAAAFRLESAGGRTRSIVEIPLEAS